MNRTSEPAATAVYLSSDRLASLSDTMFGVAMTLVVTTLLPSVQAHRGSLAEMWADTSDALITVVLSFTVSARYWVVQQQRLAMTASITPWQTWLHLVFLFLIVLVPISTSLPGLGGAGAVRASVLIYGTHLTLVSLVNLLLWMEVHRTAAARRQIVQSLAAFALLGVALAVGAFRPEFSLYLWFAVLPTPVLVRAFAPRFQGR